MSIMSAARQALTQAEKLAAGLPSISGEREGRARVRSNSLLRGFDAAERLRTFLLLHFQHRFQRALAEMAGRGGKAPLGGFDGTRMLWRSLSAACRRGIRDLARSLG